MATPLIRPFRDVSEHFVLNLYTWSGAIPTAGVPRGTFVQIVSGWQSDQNLADGGPVGGFNPTNPLAVSRRYKINSQVSTASSGSVLGITLYETRELDENGLPLIFNPAKQAQLQAVLSGQAVPVATKGVFLYSGLAGTGLAIENAPAYTSGGLLCAQGGPGATQVGIFLGRTDSKGWTLFKLDI
jgi:hypothetical protein